MDSMMFITDILDVIFCTSFLRFMYLSSSRLVKNIKVMQWCMRACYVCRCILMIFLLGWGYFVTPIGQYRFGVHQHNLHFSCPVLWVRAGDVNKDCFIICWVLEFDESVIGLHLTAYFRLCCI